jgi:hypothetical protein
MHQYILSIKYGNQSANSIYCQFIYILDVLHLSVWQNTDDVFSVFWATYRLSHEMSAKFQVVIDWLILSEKWYVNMGFNCYIIMTDEKGGNSKQWVPTHFSLQVTQYLNQCYRNCWTGHRGPHAWPTHLPDLTTFACYLWGYMKGLVYQEKVTDTRWTLTVFHWSRCSHTKQSWKHTESNTCHFQTGFTCAWLMQVIITYVHDSYVQFE